MNKVCDARDIDPCAQQCSGRQGRGALVAARASQSQDIAILCHRWSPTCDNLDSLGQVLTVGRQVSESIASSGWLSPGS